MRSIRWVAAAAAVSAFSAGVAIAQSTQTSETTAVTGDFHASIVSQSQRQCDANHLKFHATFAGEQTSSDPRLAGKLKLRVVSVVNTANGYGWTKARVRVSDAATGKPKFNGHAVGVLEPGDGVEGFLTGRTVRPGSTRLLANFNAQQDETGALTGEFGKDSQSGGIQDPAILTDACRRGHRGEHGKQHERRGGDNGRGHRKD
jgi:hypothetical protein